jgi:hypothetical protein
MSLSKYILLTKELQNTGHTNCFATRKEAA